MKDPEPADNAEERAKRAENYKRAMAATLDAKLTEDRGRLVAKCRLNPQVWPDGIGPWYKPEDWGPTDEKGIARPVNTVPVTAIVNKPEPVNTGEDVNKDRAAYMREYMRKRRAGQHAPHAR